MHCGRSAPRQVASGQTLIAQSIPHNRRLFLGQDVRMQRTATLGNAGSGRTTLARALGKRLELHGVHLHTIFWEPDWVEPDAGQIRLRVSEAITAEAWISDGNMPGAHSTLPMPT
jgi:hypothetical protein